MWLNMTLVQNGRAASYDTDSWWTYTKAFLLNASRQFVPNCSYWHVYNAPPCSLNSAAKPKLVASGCKCLCLIDYFVDEFGFSAPICSCVSLQIPMAVATNRTKTRTMHSHSWWNRNGRVRLPGHEHSVHDWRGVWWQWREWRLLSWKGHHLDCCLPGCTSDWLVFNSAGRGQVQHHGLHTRRYAMRPWRLWSSAGMMVSTFIVERVLKDWCFAETSG